MTHQVCKALVLHCIDFRFRRKIAEFLDSKFGDSYDLVSVAGGVKQLVTDPAENNFIMEQLEISNRLHHPESIILIQHEDCGAYGGSQAFKDFSMEQEHQNSELKKAEELLSKKFFQPKEKYFVRLSGEIIAS